MTLLDPRLDKLDKRDKLEKLNKPEKLERPEKPTDEGLKEKLISKYVRAGLFLVNNG